MENWKKQLVIIKHKGKLVSAVIEDGALDEVIVEDEQELRNGDIYVGRVSHIVKNIHAAFVEVQKNTMCYVPLAQTGTEKVVQGQELLVQIKKAAVKTKQAVASCKLEFSGKYAVITTINRTKNLSSKITDEPVREHLKSLLVKYKDCPFGIILRTSCEHADDMQIQTECEQLIEEASEVIQRAKSRVCFTRVFRADMEFVKYLKSTEKHAFDRIITDEMLIYEQLINDVTFSEENIVLYEDESYSLDKLFGLPTKLEKALARHVWLKSGASLVIEPTEALTVIDVNTQKAVDGKRSSETTFFKINKEAAKEAARQIRVRNISGIILIDFIDMKKKEHVQALLHELEKECKKDKVKTTVVDMTKLGLVEITRMKLRKPLWESLR